MYVWDTKGWLNIICQLLDFELLLFINGEIRLDYKIGLTDYLKVEL